jgi:hypothetical protein
VSAAPSPLRYTAPLICTACGREFGGLWVGEKTGPQQCPCGHVFKATWPGFTFEPEVVIVSPDGEVVRRGAA